MNLSETVNHNNCIALAYSDPRNQIADMPADKPACRWFDAFELEGQRYERIGEQPYTRRDGQLTAVAVWQAICRVCEQPWQFIRTDRPVPSGPPRQCRSCAAKAREAKARENQTGQYNPSKRLTSVTAPYVPAWMIPGIKAEQDVPRTPSPPPVNTVTPHVNTAPASVNTPSKPASVKRKGVFTDR